MKQANNEASRRSQDDEIDRRVTHRTPVTNRLLGDKKAFGRRTGPEAGRQDYPLTESSPLTLAYVNNSPSRS